MGHTEARPDSGWSALPDTLSPPGCLPGTESRGARIRAVAMDMGEKKKMWGKREGKIDRTGEQLNLGGD